ncbi:sensor domain-containing diguanylate cyclase [Pseudoalteromonas tunicata]|uniref:sensor domain-containing diguanylate cyclase n=1 Tax=Pseudoalteromonas tunicata TaxID=314281 RepID=UPI00273E1FC6|nr:sensor domain-containing diguanylate cyclase [Pseudoalteromonas tunicata]MDP4983193.1 diguanylate cyclase [Pseudoalteromonas tunicata]MDP5211807.1 diguanylate cyclase [Pseudoalteromonas tunicata]
MPQVSLNETGVLERMTDIVACLNSSDSIHRFLLDIHCILQKVTYADNFYVVLLGEDKRLTFPYFHDVKDDFDADELNGIALADLSSTLTYYALAQQSVCNFNQSQLLELTQAGTIKVLGSLPKQWLCFPLKNRDSFLGAFIIQSYRREDEYSGVIVDILFTISHIIASALDAFNNQQALFDANQRLAEYQNELEDEVDKRTQELQKSLLNLQHEIEQRKQLQALLEFDSTHDNLTGLANRKSLFNELARISARIERQPSYVYLLYLDLDGFKPVNDTYGHHAGDLVLVEVSKRLIKAMRRYDLVARIGGDEFVVVIDQPLDENELCQIAGRIIDDMQQPIYINEKQTVHCGISIGIAFTTLATEVGEVLISHADSALYEAKNNGKGCFKVFHP